MGGWSPIVRVGLDLLAQTGQQLIPELVLGGRRLLLVLAVLCVRRRRRVRLAALLLPLLVLLVRCRRRLPAVVGGDKEKGERRLII